MDTEDESTAYLKLFSEGTHNYLLHSSEDGLNDAFPVEPIFTEISSEWSSETFPILLSGPLVSDENNDSESTSNVQMLSEENDNSCQNDELGENNSVTFFSNVDRNSVILSNDVLLKVEESGKDEDRNTITHVINGDTYSITYTPDSQDEGNDDESLENIEVIELLNIDGTITTINKSLLDIVHAKTKGTNYDNYYTQVQANKCKMCPFLCESVEDMITHVKIKHDRQVHQNNGSTINTHVNNDEIVATKMTSILNTQQNKKKYTLYVCSTCGSGYSVKEDLKQHMISQHQVVEARPFTTRTVKAEEIPPDKSDESDQKRSARAKSASLIKNQMGMRSIKCSIKGCQLRFNSEESCKKHEDCHVDQNKKQFVCPECKKKFSIWRVCSMHMWKCHSIDLGLLTCPMCNEFKSYSSVTVVNHMAVHNEEKPFMCAACGKTFKQPNKLIAHEATHRTPLELPKSLTQKQCEFCDRIFANSKSLKKHIKFVHDKFKPFICNICGHQTSRKEMLQLHHRQHTGDKPFHCSYCDYKTGDRNCLRKHTMRHFGVAKYGCPYCDYQAIQTSAYKAHLASKHPGKEGSYACTTCRYSTVNLHSYLSHVKYHEFEKTKKVNEKIEKRANVEDSESKSSDETHNFLNTEHSEEAVDTGGITIPAGFDLELTNEQTLLKGQEF